VVLICISIMVSGGKGLLICLLIIYLFEEMSVVSPLPILEQVTFLLLS